MTRITNVERDGQDGRQIPLADTNRNQIVCLPMGGEKRQGQEKSWIVNTQIWYQM